MLHHDDQVHARGAGPTLSGEREREREREREKERERERAPVLPF